MTKLTESDQPIAQLFAQSVVEGSVRYWAAHFTRRQRQPAVQAALCFAHLMDQLTTVSPEVIAEKSVWWHEELTDCSAKTARHPITQALLRTSTDPEESVSKEPESPAIIDTMHRHLHGALMSQQQTVLDTADAWTQYAELRFGTLHQLLALASGMSPEAASKLVTWTARLHGLGVVRAPNYYSDARILCPAKSLLDAKGPSLKESLYELGARQPPAAAGNHVLIHHELTWWKRKLSDASPVFTGLPVGLRGMLASWRAARRAQF